MNALERRVIDISFKKKLSHIGSNLTAVNLIEEIYNVRKPDDPFILSSGHAGLALYVVLERFGGNAEELFDLHGVHPNRDMAHGIWASSGSLGHGLGIAVGYAVADKTRNVYALASDGELAEGSCFEALRLASRLHLDNLHVTVNCNGWGAYSKIDVDWLQRRFNFFPMSFRRTKPVILEGQDAHYHVLTESEYAEIVRG